jgi:O-antigen ligase
MPVSQVAAPRWHRGGLAVVVAVASVAWLAGIVAFFLPTVFAALVGAVAGLILGRLADEDDRVWLALAFVPAAALIATGLVPTAGRYLPVLVVGTAIAAAIVPDLLRHPRSLVLPNRFVSVAAIGYLAWFGISTVVSSEPSVSREYLAGAVGTLGLLLFIIPTVLRSPAARHALLVTFAGLGLALVAMGLLIALAGSLVLNGLTLGSYALLQLTVLGHQTALIVPRITGPYLSPSNDAVALAIAVIALLALHEQSRTRRRLIVVAIAVCFVGLAATFDRNGLLILTTGAATSAAIAFLNRRSIGLPAVISVLATVLLAAFLLNVVGATQPQGPDALQVRGGTSLSGRDKLWLASGEAIADRPVFGFGPGTNVDAIAPHLSTQLYAGLTSHDTWLRTGVELGIPGLILLLAFVLAVVGSVWRLFRRSRLDSSLVGLASVSVAMLFGFTFETFLLGGLTFGSVVLPLVAGMLTSIDVTAAATPAS